jgi:hypothetical protein
VFLQTQLLRDSLYGAAAVAAPAHVVVNKEFRADQEHLQGMIFQ